MGKRELTNCELKELTISEPGQITWEVKIVEIIDIVAQLRVAMVERHELTTVMLR